MKRWWVLYRQLPWDWRMLLGAAALSLIPFIASLIIAGQGSQDPAPADPASQPGLDTFIPQGFVLVPIEVENYESLDSILGRYGVVDLFRSKGQLAARNVRMLRAPHNPSQFAVLLPDGQVDQVLRQGGSFTIVVKRSGEFGTRIVTEPTKTKRTIIYE